MKGKIFIAPAFIFTLIFSTIPAEAHYQILNNAPESAIKTTFNFDNHEKVEFAKKRYRCKICGHTFNTGIGVAGHIRGNHGKWLIHRYYETF